MTVTVFAVSSQTVFEVSGVGIEIKVAEVGKSFLNGQERINVLNSINITIPSAAKVAIVGPSGSGKSTLLNLIGTLEKPDNGEILYDKKDIFRLHSDRLADWRNTNIGFVFQFHRLLPDFTALENVMMPGIIAGMKNEQNKQRAKNLLEQIGLEHRMNIRPSRLSGGEQQRIATARALALNPTLLLADEPTGNLDHETGQKVLDLILAESESNRMTCIIVTHNREYLSEMDIVFELRDGKVVST